MVIEATDYTPKQPIKIQTMNPRDIVAYQEGGCLFVADPYNKNVWLLLADGTESSERLISKVDAWSLSVNAALKQLLVTSPSVLYEYGLNDLRRRKIPLLRQIPLRKYMDANHSLRTSTGSILVCHTGTANDGDHHQVSEIDDSGAVLRVFGGRIGGGVGQLYRPMYVDVDERGRAFVAENFGRRVILLDSNLKFDRVILKTEDLWSSEEKETRTEKEIQENMPTRVKYWRQRGQLVVTLNNGGVYIYDVKRRKTKKDKKRT